MTQDLARREHRKGPAALRLAGGLIKIGDNPAGVIGDPRLDRDETVDVAPDDLELRIRKAHVFPPLLPP
jgi:hypothetical protein